MENEAKMEIPDSHKVDFETLKKAFANDDVALLSCTDKATGEQMSALCALNFSAEKKEVEFVPFAFMPLTPLYDRLIPATPDDVSIYTGDDTVPANVE